MSGHRIILVPGYIHSATDGQRHYISATQLARLYRLTREEQRRTFVRYADQEPTPGFRAQPGDEILRPRADGRYDRQTVQPA